MCFSPVLFYNRAGPSWTCSAALHATDPYNTELE